MKNEKETPKHRLSKHLKESAERIKNEKLRKKYECCDYEIDN